MANVHVIKAERRNGPGQLQDGAHDNRNRTNRPLLYDDLKMCLDAQKWKYERLLEVIANGEQKKFVVTKVSYGVFAVLAGLVAAISALISKLGDDAFIFYSLHVSLLVLLVGANLINVTVIRYIAALKSEVLLATRQLNCVRQSIHICLYSLIEGVLPTDDFRKTRGKPEVYWRLVGTHIKYPLDNDGLRKCYLKKNGDMLEPDYKALYRSADLFSICSIAVFNTFLTFTPVALYFYTSFQANVLEGSFLGGIWFALFALFVAVGFFLLVKRIMKTFYANVIKPLIPEGMAETTLS